MCFSGPDVYSRQGSQQGGLARVPLSVQETIRVW
jgi:hypothetical protein